MSFRTGLIVLLALVCGGSAAVGINMLRNQDPPSSKAETVAVLVAARDIPRGAMITADSTTTEDYLNAPSGTVTSMEDVLDRVVFVPLMKGEPILDSKLAPKGAGRGMAALIPKGMRAISIQTPSVASAGGGFILPGSRVDVLMIPNSQGGNEDLNARVTPVLQNVEVWAVGPRVEAPAENKVDTKELREVTLLATPEQATNLALVQNRGSLHLTLRNPEDTGVIVAQPREPEKEQPQKPPEVVKPQEVVKEPEPIRIRTLHGTQDGAVHVKLPDKAFDNR